MEDVTQKLYKDKIDLAHFNKIAKQISKTQERPYSRYGFDLTRTYNNYDYKLEDVERSSSNLNLVDMRKISKYFYRKSSSYKRIIDFFAEIYKYYYVVDLKKISDSKKNKTILKLYTDTLDFLDNINIKDTFSYISKRVLLDGAFFGYVNTFDDNRITITQLNPNYCRSRDTSAYGTAMVEFNVLYLINIQTKQI